MAAHERPESLMDECAYAPAESKCESIAEMPGDLIGPYKLLEQIGEGGFGIVYMAEQSRPVRRKVALKIIKPGMDTKEVVARFEAERQALALMDHPYIAQVFDGGTTATGRPYFVMELVHGVPITSFCDAQRLSQSERLRLFIDVCRGVQHAHHKGVIHRDLKPSNVMVTMHDDKAIPKVIDFGVSKAISQQLTARTLFTAYGQMVGTPMYMSPEQAQLSCLDVDTRSDVYSLGVLLYELITGSTPYNESALKRVGFDEMRRMIREDEPLRPSVRVETLRFNELSTVADRRQIDPRRLSQSLRGELDWIVMKCLEKDRSRRYETASGLAADVLHYLNDEPVSAAAPSPVYRAGKFFKRNKAVVVASAAVLLGLVAGIVGLAIGLVSQARQRAIAQREYAEVQLNYGVALQAQRNYTEAEALYREWLQNPSGDTPADLRRAAVMRLRLAEVVDDAKGPAEAMILYSEALEAYRAAFPPGDANIAHALTKRAFVLRTLHRFDEAEPLFREAFEIHRRSVPADHRAIGESATNLANVLISLDRTGEAEPIAREAIAEHLLAVPQDNFALAFSRLELGRDLLALGKFPEAEVQLLEANRMFAPTDQFRLGQLALSGLYTKWDQVEPGKGHDVKAGEWTHKLIGTFVRLDPIETHD
jgi:non-specific serine/threonine protein kinase/serine/threonine-protein kinase